MATVLRNLESRDTAFVLLFDPKDLVEVPLDTIRRGTPFDLVMSSSEPQALLLKSDERSIRVTIQSTRLELVHDVRTPFRERDLSDLRKLLDVLPELAVKSFGINYTVFFSVAGFPTAGLFLKDRFLKQPTGFEDKLEGQVIANSTRMIFGEPDQYRDVRFTPADLQSDVVVLQYHYHREEQVRDKERAFRLLEDQYKKELVHLESLTKLL